MILKQSRSHDALGSPGQPIQPHNRFSFTEKNFNAGKTRQDFAQQTHTGIPMSPVRHEKISKHLFLDQSESYTQENLAASKQALQAEITKRKTFLSSKWRERITGCAPTGRAAIPYWKYLLNGRRMILSDREDLDVWLDFVSLCRNNGNSAMAERV